MRKIVLAFLLALLAFQPIALAQVDFGKVVADFFGVILIIAIIIVLLALGEVLHLPKGIGHWGTIVILLILVFLVPYILVTYFSQYFPSYAEIPESFKYYKLGEPASTFFRMLGLPSEWSYVPAIIYLFILPFAGIYVIVWSFLTMLGIFPQKNVNRVLAFLITFLTIPIGFFVKMVWLLFSVMGAWSVAVFAITFIVGIFLRGAGFVSKEYAEYKKYIQTSKKGMSELIKKLEEAKKGTVGQMREAARDAINVAPAFNIGTKTVQKLQMAVNPQTPDEEVPKYIDEAIGELKKESRS
jgi:hypothetical protein